MSRAGRRAAAAACVLAAAVAACGGGDDEPLVPAAPEVQREVRAVFERYTAAMAQGDHGTACELLAPESVENLRAEAVEAGRPERSCPDVLDYRLSTGGADARAGLEEIARTVTVDGIYETERDGVALIAWTAEVDGEPQGIQQPARLVDGDWRLVGGR